MTDNNIIYAVIFSTLVILLLIAGVAITIFISNKQRTAQDMRMVQMQLGYEKELRTVTNEVQEQVMTNVARELHDNIGQMLTIMHIQMEQKKMLAPETKTYLEPIHTTLLDVTRQVKVLGRSLNSELAEQNGLLKTIQMEVDRLQELGHIKVHWTNDDTEPLLSQDQRLMVFRIFQEVVNNILKHAGAANIHLLLAGKPGFRFQIHDDGVGFDVDGILQSGSGAGLKNIMKRAALAELNCVIASEKGSGSTFTLEPMKKIN